MRINDPRAMRALAHPLRLELLELLGQIGPATAAACARRLDTSQASCSFHLRQLAKYGFVTAAEPSGDQRERPWRLTDTDQDWSYEDGGAAADELERVFVEREAARVLAWLAARGKAPEPWRSASFVGGLTAPMTPDELKSVQREIGKLLEPYAERARAQAPEATEDGVDGVDGESRYVRVFFSGTPLP
jgi:hypothetical protein